MMLTILAAILMIVIFPILGSVLPAAAPILFAAGTVAVGLAFLFHGVSCARNAAEQPVPVWRAAVMAVAVYLLLPALTRAIHENLIAYSGATLQYLSIFQPMLFGYGVALLLIYKQHGLPSGAAKAGVLLLALGSVFALCGGWAIAAIGPLAAILIALENVAFMLGMLLTAFTPSEHGIQPLETVGIWLIAGAGAADCAAVAITQMTRTAFPSVNEIFRLAIVAGFMIFLLPAFSGKHGARQLSMDRSEPHGMGS